MNSILDTRDLQKRLDELEGYRDTLNEAREERQAIGASPASTKDEIDAADNAVRLAEMDFGEDEQAELAELENIQSEIGREWRHGVQLIPESDFEDYCRQLAEDIGAIPDDAQWPCTCIDWAQAAKELQADYSTVTYQGTDYYRRN